MSFPDTLPLNFTNFFPHLIIHPKDAIEEDLKLTWTASIILGIFTIGLVHGIYALYVYFSKNAEVKTESNISAQEKTVRDAAVKTFKKFPEPNNHLKPTTTRPIQKDKPPLVLTGNLSLRGGKAGYVGRKEEWKPCDFTDCLLNISHEDGSSLELDPKDILVYCEIYDRSEDLKNSGMIKGPVLPLSLFIGKKHEDTISFRYKGELVSLKIVQRLFTNFFPDDEYLTEEEKRSHIPPLHELLNGEIYRARYETISQTRFVDRKTTIKEDVALRAYPTSLLNSCVISFNKGFFYKACPSGDNPYQFNLVGNEDPSFIEFKSTIQDPSFEDEYNTRTIIFKNGLLKFKLSVPGYNTKKGDTFNFFLDDSILVFIVNKLTLFGHKQHTKVKREQKLFIFRWTYFAEDLKTENPDAQLLKKLNLDLLKDQLFQAFQQEGVYSKDGILTLELDMSSIYY